MLDAWINAEIPLAIEVARDRKMVPPVVMATTHWSTHVPGCSGIDVLIESWIFEISTNCVASSSLAATHDVVVQSGVIVNFISPEVSLGPGFSVEKGAEISVIVNP